MSSAGSVLLGPPPLPPPKKSKITLLPNFFKSSSDEKKSLNRKYSLRKKNSGNSDKSNTNTYRSFSRDIYDGGPVVFRNSEPYEVKFLKREEQEESDHRRQDGNLKTNNCCQGRGSSDLLTSLRRYNRAASVSSLFSFSRSHSDSNLSSICSSAAEMNMMPYSAAYRYPQQYGFTKYFRGLSGSWKNLLNLGGMNRPQKITPQIKKVAPPSVPDSTYRHSGSSFGSVGYSSSGEDSCFADSTSKEIYDSNSDCYGMPGKSPNSQFNYPVFTFAAGPGSGSSGGQYMQLHTSKNAVYYHHQLSLQEDQGIDMTQSPGRDSPGSSGSGSGSRHSTASVDSGRASGCHLTTPHSRSSLSSSSSADHNVPAKVERLLMQGVPDQDVLHSWLLDLHFEEYFPLFLSSGYDMHTIIRMTPEDLTAIGIKKPNHRKKLKAEIAQLNISDGLPDYIPGSLHEWLILLRLEEYKTALLSQGYETIDDVLQLTWEDLEDIGIVKLGHQKRLLLAIKRIKDLKAGKIFNAPPALNLIQTQASIESGSPCSTVSSVAFSDYDNSRLPTNTYRSYYQPWDSEATQHLYYQNDIIVPIKVRSGRGKSLESLKDGSNGQNVASSSSGGTSSFHCVPVVPAIAQSCLPGWKYRSYDDGDITPTNETVPLHEGGGTLPRPRGLVRPRPVAKIPATFVPAYRTQEINSDDIELKRRPPSPPKRHSESITVVADLHCTNIPPDPAPCSPVWSAEERQLIACLKAQDSDHSFKSSSSSTESDSIPFANENAGTIKQRISRSNSEYNDISSNDSKISNINVISSKASSNNSNNDGKTTKQLPKSINSHEESLRKPNKEPIDVLDDIGHMLANLTDELDAMLEEEKRQGLNADN